MLGSCGCWVTGWPGDRVPVSWGVGVSRRSPQCIRELQLFVLLLLCFHTSNSLPPRPCPDFDKNPISRCHQLGMASAHLPKGCAVKTHLTLFPPPPARSSSPPPSQHPPPPAARQVHAALMATEHMAHIQPASRGQGWESVPLTVPAAAVPGTP